jgi:hypothetical protein
VGGWWRVLRALGGRPDLWFTALRTAKTLAPPRWWATTPHLPVPARDYLRFRMATANGGDGTGAPVPAELIGYLEWQRRVQR